LNQSNSPSPAATTIANELSAGVEGLANTVPSRDLISRVESPLGDSASNYGNVFWSLGITTATALVDAAIPDWVNAVASGVGAILARNGLDFIDNWKSMPMAAHYRRVTDDRIRRWAKGSDLVFGFHCFEASISGERWGFEGVSLDLRFSNLN